MHIIVMGAAGAGKTTVGSLLAQALRWPFLDGDDLHSAANVAKMAAGIPLTDEDRRPWLERLRQRLEAATAAGQSLVLACSALKERYRQLLAGDETDARFVYLKASAPLLRQRLAARRGHFMKQAMLESQLAALEEPAGAVVVDATAEPEEAVRFIRQSLGV